MYLYSPLPLFDGLLVLFSGEEVFFLKPPPLLESEVKCLVLKTLRVFGRPHPNTHFKVVSSPSKIEKSLFFFGLDGTRLLFLPKKEIKKKSQKQNRKNKTKKRERPNKRKKEER